MSQGKTKSDTVIYVGSGSVPRLTSTDKTEVEDWCEGIMFDGRNVNKVYMPQALIHFSIQSFEHGSKEFNLVKSHINDWANDYIDRGI